MIYTCGNCGEEHECWPAIAYQFPFNFASFNEEEKQRITRLSDDFCVIQYEDQTDRFIRGVLIQRVKGSCQDLEYGVWVSLSEKSFQDYEMNYESQNHLVNYFGWLCNWIPEYENTFDIKTTVRTQRGKKRPIVTLNEDNDFNNPFVKDYFEGISEKEALDRINRMMRKN